ncbi:MAG TPA: peptidoglycan DD-metalloendopeptidase family protein [Pyrinomonadaceae bacterium]|nr:peptidoglycan DD-metalloendopeptidase family protein [Pyrinomonadaceae bacterium]
MKWARHPRTRFLLAFIGIVAVVVSLVVRLGRFSKTDQPPIARTSAASPESLPSPLTTPSRLQSPTPTASPETSLETSLETSPSPSLASPSPPTAVAAPNPGLLIIPVAGVRADQLIDTFDAARTEGRVHDAIDIPAPSGTPVLATADGTIVKLFQSDRGGITIYQLSADQKFFYYYAHLARYAEGLAEGQVVKQGATIAYVGDTGNAGAGNYHLHFSIAVASDPKRWWDGVNINPYPLLKR